MAPLPKPEAPLLRETTSPFAINWMGRGGTQLRCRTRRLADRAVDGGGPDISDGVNEWNPETMVLFRDVIVSFSSGIHYRVTAKTSGRSAPSNVISVQHSEENQPPVVTLEPALTTTQDRASSLRPAGRTMACRREEGGLAARRRWPCISAMPIGLKPGLVYDAGHLCADVHGGRWAVESSKTVTVTVGEAAKAPADFVVITAKFMAWLRAADGDEVIKTR